MPAEEAGKQTAMALRYQYDMFKAYGARGNARMQAIEERGRDSKTPDPPVSKAMKETKQITKILNRPSEPSLINRALSDTNGGFCKSCRRLFQGTGDHAMNLLKNDTQGVCYSHWDGY